MGPKMQGDELLFIVEEDVDGGYFAHAVGQSIVTQADTRDQIAEMVRDAVRCHFDSPEDLPKRVRLHFIHDEVGPIATLTPAEANLKIA